MTELVNKQNKDAIQRRGIERERENQLKNVNQASVVKLTNGTFQYETHINKM